jgi:subtilisin family serine protease
MKKTPIPIIGLALAGLLATAAGAQLLQGLPRVGGVLDQVGPLTNSVAQLPDRATHTLASARLDRIAALVRANPDRVAIDPGGFPARAHEVVVNDPDEALIAAARARGYRLIERGEILGAGFARFEAPADRSLKTAIRDLTRLGAKDASADQLHFESGLPGNAIPQGPAPGPVAIATSVTVGMIDGGVAGDIATQRGFAAGAPRASDHGTAIASLITGQGGVRGAAPGARLLAADVYGTDPAGGNATAIAKAVGWLVGQRVPVVTISLVGPANPLLARVVMAAQARGVMIVAAVGNDGPAAPPVYPASYPGVIAVTGVDSRNRVLIEAGRATHLDYAAPGADMLAATAGGKAVAVRGTSFAAPLVAATIARLYPASNPGKRNDAIARVDAGARRLGARFGRGLVCGDCRTPVR